MYRGERRHALGRAEVSDLALRAGHSAWRSAASCVLCSSSRNVSKTPSVWSAQIQKACPFGYRVKGRKKILIVQNLKDLQPRIGLFSHDSLSHAPMDSLKSRFPLLHLGFLAHNKGGTYSWGGCHK